MNIFNQVSLNEVTACLFEVADVYIYLISNAGSMTTKIIEILGTIKKSLEKTCKWNKRVWVKFFLK